MFLADQKDRVVFAWYIPNMGAYGNTVAGYKTEIQQAQAIGVDGFGVDMMGWDPGNSPAYNGFSFQTMATDILEAALELGTGFKIFFILDFIPYGSICSDAAGAMMTAHAAHANYYHYNGRPFLSAYDPSPDAASGSANNTFHSAVLTSTTNAGFNVFYVPTWGTYGSMGFANSDEATTYASISSSIAHWIRGLTNGIMVFPSLTPSYAVTVNAASNHVVKDGNSVLVSGIISWFGQIRFVATAAIAGVCPFVEQNGGEGLDTVWAEIRTRNPQMVMLNSWNDYTESYMGPAAQADLTTIFTPGLWQITGDYLFSHAGFTQLNKYFIQWFKTGVQPVWPDAMYVFYRIAATSVVPSSPPAGASVSWNPDFNNATLDDLYVTTILTAPATVRITTNGVDHDTSVAAGVVHTRQAFTAGAQRFRVIRGATTLIDIVGTDIVLSLTKYYNANPITYYATA